MSADLPGRPAYLAFLPDFLFVPDAGRARYVVKAWLLALIPSIALSALVSLVVRPATHPDFPVDSALAVFLLVVVSPLLETLLLIPPLIGFKRLFGPGPAVVASALLWGIVHSLAAPAWGLIVWWPFLIMSIAFLSWSRQGYGMAAAIVVAIHALQNGFVLLLANLALLAG